MRFSLGLHGFRIAIYRCRLRGIGKKSNLEKSAVLPSLALNKDLETWKTPQGLNPIFRKRRKIGGLGSRLR